MVELANFMARIWKTGKSRVITIPQDILEANGLKEGERILVFIHMVRSEDFVSANDMLKAKEKAKR